MNKTKIKVLIISLLFFSSFQITNAIYWETGFIWWDNIWFSTWYAWDGQIVWPQTKFNWASQVIFNWGKYYISDTKNNCIRFVDSTWIINTLAWNCGSSWDYLAWTWTGSKFNTPIWMTLDWVNGLLYVVDSGNHKIRSIDINTKEVLDVVWSTQWYKDGIWIDSQFSYPYWIKYFSWLLYVTDTSNHRIRKVDIETKEVTTVAGNWSDINQPYAIDLNDTGTILYIWDNSKVYTYNLSTSTLTAILSTWLWNVKWLTFNKVLNELYISDTINHVIKRIKLATNTTDVFVWLSWTPGYKEDLPIDARLRWPGLSSIDTQTNTMYLSDMENNLVRQIDLNYYAPIDVKKVEQRNLNKSYIPVWWSQDIDDMFYIYLNFIDSDNVSNYIDFEFKDINQSFDGADIVRYTHTWANATYAKDLLVWNWVFNNIPKQSDWTKKVKWRYRIVSQEETPTVNTWWQYYWNNSNFDTDITLWKVLFSKTKPIYEKQVNSVILYNSSKILIADKDNCIKMVDKQAKNFNNYYLSDYELIAWTCWTSWFDFSKLNTPNGMVLDEVNNLLYIADTENNRIQVVNLTTKIMSTLAWWTFWDFDGVWVNAQFKKPTKLDLSKDKSILYVVDSWNNKVKKIDITSGQVLTLFSNSKIIVDIVLDEDLNNLYYWINGTTYSDIDRWIWIYNLNSNQSVRLYSKINYTPNWYSFILWLDFDQENKNIYIILIN